MVRFYILKFLNFRHVYLFGEKKSHVKNARAVGVEACSHAIAPRNVYLLCSLNREGIAYCDASFLQLIYRGIVNTARHIQIVV